MENAAGKTIVITGATSGVGEAAAELLAHQGARVIFTARDRDRGEQLLRRLRDANPAQEHAAHYGDLSLLSEMRRVGAELAERLPRVDVLANNAGGWFDERFETPDGLELTFALNHMSYFVITTALLDALNATAGARVANTSSMAQRMGSIDFDDLQTRNDYSMLLSYSRSKRCNVLFTQSLARRLAPGRTTTSFHPGTVVVTGMWGANPTAARNRAEREGQIADLLTPAQAGEVLAWHALDAEPAQHSGAFYNLRERVDLPPDDEAAEQLWRISEEIAAG